MVPEEALQPLQLFFFPSHFEVIIDSEEVVKIRQRGPVYLPPIIVRYQSPELSDGAVRMCGSVSFGPL